MVPKIRNLQTILKCLARPRVIFGSALYRQMSYVMICDGVFEDGHVQTARNSVQPVCTSGIFTVEGGYNIVYFKKWSTLQIKYCELRITYVLSATPRRISYILRSGVSEALNNGIIISVLDNITTIKPAIPCNYHFKCQHKFRRVIQPTVPIFKVTSKV